MIKHRYYMGRHLVRVETEYSDMRTVLITHLEKGKVGNSKVGYKFVNKGDQDIVPIRCLWTHKRRDKINEKDKLKQSKLLKEVFLK